jgi:hypothetical protein
MQGDVSPRLGDGPPSDLTPGPSPQAVRGGERSERKLVSPSPQAERGSGGEVLKKPRVCPAPFVISLSGTRTRRDPELAKFFDDYVAFVRVTIGAHADALVDFGLTTPKTRAPLTAEQKAVAAAKRKATRAARGTKSKKAKQSVHGSVDAKLIVTPTTQK